MATNKDALDSHAKKRKRVETEGASGFNRTRFSAAKETHYSTGKRVLEGAIEYSRTASGMVVPQEIDRLKKMQCSVTLKRLMVHRDGWPFRKSAQGKALDIHGDSDTPSKPLMDLDTIKWKLDNGFYKNTNQFAGDIRIMFCNAILHYPVMHEIHKIAEKLSDFFEGKWKSLEERWAAEKEKAKREEDMPKPFGKVREVSVGVKACQSVTSKAEKRRKLVSAMNSGGMSCPNSLCQAPSKVSSSRKNLSTEQATTNAKPKQHLLDTILASMSSLFGCNVDLQRKKEREAARMKLQQTKRTVFIDDNLKSFEELEQLCGHSLTDSKRINPLKEYFGLVLNDEIRTHLDEEILV